MMRAATLIVAAALALGSCATLGKEKAPVCATPPGSEAPKAAPAADNVSALPATYGSCA